MRWREKEKLEPRIGDERVVTKFALFPIRCDNGEWAWLEKVDILQGYVKQEIDGMFYAIWVNKRFV